MKGQLKVHSENILPIIKRWLYSEKEIFIRELVSNACDALQKLRMLRDQNQVEALDESFEIKLSIDAEKRTLTIADTGIGMTANEVETFIAEVAFSGAETFLKNYQSNDEKDQIIGHFGLGFYSSYMVADSVDIHTLSYEKDAIPVFWSCDGSSEYEVNEGSRDTRGTKIILHLNEESGEFLDSAHLRKLLTHYCGFLPFPIYLNDEHINKTPPLWIKSSSECTEEEYLDFYRTLHPMDPDPLFWIHLNIDYPFNLKGILYFPKSRKQIDQGKDQIKLFCNRVFVSDNCKDLIPEYLTMLKGAIDSPDIPLNVSRSTLQTDKTVRQLASHIAKKVSDRLTSLYRTDKKSFIEKWEDLEWIVKLGAMQDEKFYEKIKECLIWKNTKGEWTTLLEYQERFQDKENPKVFYTGDDKGRSQILDLYHERGLEVLCTKGIIDTHLLSFLETKESRLHFQRVDGSIDAVLDQENQKGLLDSEGKSEETRIGEAIQRLLGEEELQIEAKSLVSKAPGIVVFEEQSRRMTDILSYSNPEAMKEWKGSKPTFVVNTNSPLIEKVRALADTNAPLAKSIMKQIYDQALLSQREMKTIDLDAFIVRNCQVLEELVALHS